MSDQLDDVERRVAMLDSARPSENDETRASLNTLLDEVSDPSVRALYEPKSRFWRRRPVLGAMLGVVIAGASVGIPAAAITWLAHTGIYGANGTETDGSEWIGVDAADAPQAIQNLYPAWMPLPNGVTRTSAERSVAGLYQRSVDVAQQDDPAHVVTQATSIKHMFETYGTCAWYREWLAGADESDRARRDHAAVVLMKAAQWPATVATDGGGVVERLVQVAESARDGDRETVIRGYSESACASFTGEVDR